MAFRRQVSCLEVVTTLLLIYCVLYWNSTEEDNKQREGLLFPDILTEESPLHKQAQSL